MRSRVHSSPQLCRVSRQRASSPTESRSSMTSSLADAEPAPPDVLATAERAPASDIDPPSYTTTTSSEPLQPSSSHPSNTSTSTSSSDDKGLRKRSGHGRLREVDAGYTGVPVAGDGEPDQCLFGMLAGLFWMWLDVRMAFWESSFRDLRGTDCQVPGTTAQGSSSHGKLTEGPFCPS